jgi:hypothetical protein
MRRSVCPTKTKNNKNNNCGGAHNRKKRVKGVREEYRV